MVFIYTMRTPRRLIAGLFVLPLVSGCFASSGDDASADSDSGDGARLRVALPFAPPENYSPYGQDALLLSGPYGE